jgi:hypothetical protein
MFYTGMNIEFYKKGTKVERRKMEGVIQLQFVVIYMYIW